MNRESLKTRFDAVLPQDPTIVAAVLFGSRARGDAHRESDWDVALLMHDTTHQPHWPRDQVVLSEMTGTHIVHIPAAQAKRRAGQLGSIEWAIAHEGELLAGHWQRPDPNTLRTTVSWHATSASLSDITADMEQIARARPLDTWPAHYAVILSNLIKLTAVVLSIPPAKYNNPRIVFNQIKIEQRHGTKAQRNNAARATAVLDRALNFLPATHTDACVKLSDAIQEIWQLMRGRGARARGVLVEHLDAIDVLAPFKKANRAFNVDSATESVLSSHDSRAREMLNEMIADHHPQPAPRWGLIYEQRPFHQQSRVDPANTPPAFADRVLALNAAARVVLGAAAGEDCTQHLGKAITALARLGSRFDLSSLIATRSDCLTNFPYLLDLTEAGVLDNAPQDRICTTLAQAVSDRRLPGPPWTAWAAANVRRIKARGTNLYLEPGNETTFEQFLKSGAEGFRNDPGDQSLYHGVEDDAANEFLAHAHAVRLEHTDAGVRLMKDNAEVRFIAFPGTRPET